VLFVPSAFIARREHVEEERTLAALRDELPAL
jgi:hypothetical protein